MTLKLNVKQFLHPHVVKACLKMDFGLMHFHFSMYSKFLHFYNFIFNLTHLSVPSRFQRKLKELVFMRHTEGSGDKHSNLRVNLEHAITQCCLIL